MPSRIFTIALAYFLAGAAANLADDPKPAIDHALAEQYFQEAARFDRRLDPVAPDPAARERVASALQAFERTR